VRERFLWQWFCPEIFSGDFCDKTTWKFFPDFLGADQDLEKFLGRLFSKRRALSV